MRGPDCIVCDQPCVCGQVDAEGVPCHYSCQLATLDPADRHPRLPKFLPTKEYRP